MKKKKTTTTTKKHRVVSDGVTAVFSDVVFVPSTLFKMLCLRNLFPNLFKQHERGSKAPKALV